MREATVKLSLRYLEDLTVRSRSSGRHSKGGVEDFVFDCRGSSDLDVAADYLIESVRQWDSRDVQFRSAFDDTTLSVLEDGREAAFVSLLDGYESEGDCG